MRQCEHQALTETIERNQGTFTTLHCQPQFQLEETCSALINCPKLQHFAWLPDALMPAVVFNCLTPQNLPLLRSMDVPESLEERNR